MRSITSAEAKNNFGDLIDHARAEPLAAAKHGRPVAAPIALDGTQGKE